LIWDYTHSYLSAEAKNSSYNDVAFTSFESDGAGNWTIPSAVRNSTIAKTGIKSYSLSNGAITKPGLTAGRKYMLSYWLNSTVPLTIAGTVPGYPTNGATYNGWTNFVHQITGVSSVLISGTAAVIDELRLVPLDADMTSYTYRPLIGLTSVNDSKNNVNSYEYDDYERLLGIKDNGGNYLKKFQYTYAGANVNYGAVLLYLSNEKKKSFVRNNCGVNSGSEVPYIIPAGRFTSSISQEDADNQALSALNVAGQNNANTNGTCIVCDLSNAANKIVTNVCESGAKSLHQLN
jgi:YD repeat-containing protein